MKEEYAIVTGASRGIGRCAALALAASGCSILLWPGKTARDSEVFTREVAEQYNQNCLTALGDLGTESFVLELFSLLPPEPRSADTGK